MMALFSRSAVSLFAAVLVLAHATPAAAQKVRPAPAARPSAAWSDTIPPEEPPPPGPPLPAAEADAVRAVLRDYVAATQRGDGAAAARLVTRETREYYARMARMAVSAPEVQVRAAPLMERMMILMYRHRVPAAELRRLSADAAFAYTIDHGWVSGNEDADPLLSAAGVFGERDRAVLRDGNGEDVHFLREDGAWRWDMMPTLVAASTTFAPDPDSGMTEDEFVMFVLRFSNGRDPSPDIWQPLP
jgi:hypothetical protein